MTHLEAVSTEDAVINNQPEQDNRELIKFVDDADGSSPVSEMIPDVCPPLSRANNRYYLLEIIHFEGDEDNDDVTLTLTVDGDPGHEYILRDELGSFDSLTTGASEFELVAEQGGDNPVRRHAEFKISGHDRVNLGLRDWTFDGLRDIGTKILDSGGTSDSVAYDADLTIETTGNARLKAALFAVQNRGEI